MKITLAPVGTAGDLFPILALGKELQGRGHVVTLCAPEEFRSVAYETGIQLVSSGPTYAEFLECRSGEDVAAGLADMVGRDVATQFVALRDALRTADVLVGSRLQIAGPSMAESHGIPYFYAVTTPPVSDYDQYPVFGVPAEKAQKRRSRRLKEWEKAILPALNRERLFTHLRPVTRLFEHLYRNGHTLFAVDPAVAPFREGANQSITGFWYFSDSVFCTLTAEDQSFVTGDGKIVYIGRLAVRDSDEIIAICRSLNSSGYRVVLGRNWQIAGELPPGCRILESFYYQPVLPRASVIVHSGDSDETSEAFRAGIPQVIWPVSVEQNYWAQRSLALGLCPAIVSNGNELSAAIRTVLDNPVFAEKSKGIAEKLLNGKESAAQIIEKVTLEHSNPRSVQ